MLIKVIKTNGYKSIYIFLFYSKENTVLFCSLCVKLKNWTIAQELIESHKNIKAKNHAVR